MSYIDFNYEDNSILICKGDAKNRKEIKKNIVNENYTEYSLEGKFNGLEIKDFFNGKKQFLMENFYRHMRKKHHVLVDSNLNPVGGEWNFDHENRKKYDGKTPLKAPLAFNHDVTEIVKMLEKQKVPNFGNINLKNFLRGEIGCINIIASIGADAVEECCA